MSNWCAYVIYEYGKTAGGKAESQGHSSWVAENHESASDSGPKVEANCTWSKQKEGIPAPLSLLYHTLMDQEILRDIPNAIGTDGPGDSLVSPVHPWLQLELLFPVCISVHRSFTNHKWGICWKSVKVRTVIMAQSETLPTYACPSTNGTRGCVCWM